MSPVPRFLRRALWAELPEPRCAYRHSPEKLLGMLLEVGHIIPEEVGGKTELADLCLCYRVYNSYKWRHTHAGDPLTGRQVRLFHPRRKQWTRHFAWSAEGLCIIGLTATGHATIEALQMNNDLIAHLRQLSILLRLYPREHGP